MENRVKMLRLEKGITQLNLATYVACSQNTISKLELGTTDIRGGLLIAVADFFNVSTDYLLCHSDYRQTVENNIKMGNLKKEIGTFNCKYNLLDEEQKEIIDLLIDKFIDNNVKKSLGV